MTEAEWLACEKPLPMLEFLHDTASERKLRLFACACCRRVWPLLTDKRSRKAVEAAEQFADGCLSPDQFAIVRASAQEAFLKVKREKQVVEATAECAPTAEYCAVCARLYAIAAARLTVAISADRSIELRDAYYENEEEWGNSGPRRGCSYWTITAAGESEETRVYAECSAKPLEEIDFDVDDAARVAGTKQEESEVVAHIALLRDIFGNPFCPLPVNPHMLAWNEGVVRKIAHSIYDEGVFDRLPILADALEEAGCITPDILNHCRQPDEHVRGCWVVDLILGKS